MSFSGATGKVEFDAKGDRKDAEITIFKLKGGKVVPEAIVKKGVSALFVMPEAAPAAPLAATPAATPAPAPAAPPAPAPAKDAKPSKAP